MKKICVVHGVGFFGSGAQASIAEFCSDLEKRTGAMVIVHRWEHPGTPPPDTRKTWLFPAIRKWVHEVIMDFGYVMTNLYTLSDSLPDADMYIGHSAGGAIISQVNRPKILMGCPLQLLYEVQPKANELDTLNIMHYRDPIAAPVSRSFNKVVYSPILGSIVNPVAAHTGYWASEETMRAIVTFYNARIRGEA